MKFLFKKTKHIRLNEQERSHGRALLAQHMGVDERSDTRARQQGYKHGLIYSLGKKHMMAGIIAAIVLALSGGTVAAAEQSLPGDTLYPVKVNVNEEVRGAFSFTPEAKADWAAARAERRMEEINHVMAQGAVSADMREQMMLRFEERVDRTEQRITILEERGNSEAAARLQARLGASMSAHEELLSMQGDDEGDEAVATAVRDMVTRMQALHREMPAMGEQKREQRRAHMEARDENGLTQASANAKAHAEAKIDTARNTLVAFDGAVEIRDRATAELQQATQFMQTANEQRAAGDYRAAVDTYHQTFRHAQRAHVLAGVGARTGISIGPINLGDQERRRDVRMRTSTDDEQGQSAVGVDGEIEMNEEGEGEEDSENKARMRSRGNVDIDAPGIEMRTRIQAESAL